MRIFKILLLAILFASTQFISADEYKINDTYSVNVWGGIISERYNESNKTFYIESCSGFDFQFNTNALNEKKYSLYNTNGEFVKYSYNSNWFCCIPGDEGQFIVKDGDVEVFRYIRANIDASTLYDVILTDDSYNEITDFSFQNLNSLTLSGAVKDLKNQEVLDIVTCGGVYNNWFLNDNYVNDITKVELVEGDVLCIGIDGIETCTKNCRSYVKSCYTVTKSLSINEANDTFDFQFYQNVTTNSVIIENSNNQITSLQLFDTNSRLITTENYDNLRELEFDLSPFESGIYFLKIVLDEKSIVKKVIIN